MTTNNNNEIRKYLVTEAVDIKQIPQEKLGHDLKLLERQETKTKLRTDLSRGVRNPNLSKVMKALQLTNPFKGY